MESKKEREIFSGSVGLNIRLQSFVANQDFAYRKKESLKLADSFERLNYKQSKINSVRFCGEVLRFLRYFDDNEQLMLSSASANFEKLKLFQTWFCKDKLCPMCNWRRSLKYDRILQLILDKLLDSKPDTQFIFLTLTQKNVPADKLDAEMKRMSKSFHKMIRRAFYFKNPAILGGVKSIEVTYNEERDDYHPHIHVLLAVSPDYFKKHYISQKEWSQVWAEVMGLDYNPVVNIKKVKAKTEEFAELDDLENQVFDRGLRKAIQETAKYPTKPIKLNPENDKVVDALHKALFRKRQISFLGIFKEIQKQLALEDVDDNLECDEQDVQHKQAALITLRWNRQRQTYLENAEFELLELDDDAKKAQKQLAELRKLYFKQNADEVLRK